jgi:hypothetical protein
MSVMGTPRSYVEAAVIVAGSLLGLFVLIWWSSGDNWARIAVGLAAGGVLGLGVVVVCQRVAAVLSRPR